MTQTAQPGHRTPAAAPTPPRSGGPGALTLALFIIPAVALFLVFFVIPVVIGTYSSFFQWNGLGGLPGVSESSKFVGFDNFIRALTDTRFRGDMNRLVLLIVLSLMIQLPFALGLAVLLHQRFLGRTMFRLLFFMPFVLSEVITAALFRMALSPRHGAVNEVARWLGLEGAIPEHGWLGTAWTTLSVFGLWEIQVPFIMFVVFFVLTWKYFGFHMIIYMAGLQGIPKELGEAASTDGANAWQVFRHITLPLLGPTIRITIFLSVIGAVQLFDMVYVLTSGGPAPFTSSVMAMTMTNRVQAGEIGYASALSVVMFLICMAFAVVYLRFVLRRDLQGAVTTMGGRR